MFCNLYKRFLKGAQAFQNQPFIDPLLNRCYWIIDKLHRKKSALESLFNEAAVRRTCSLIKEDSDTCASLRIFVIFKLCKLLQTLQTCKLSEFTNFQNNFFEENLWMPASTLFLKRDSNTGASAWILWIFQEHLFCRGSTKCWFWSTSARSLFNKVRSLTY